MARTATAVLKKKKKCTVLDQAILADLKEGVLYSIILTVVSDPPADSE